MFAYHGQNPRFDTQNQINQARHIAVASTLWRRSRRNGRKVNTLLAVGQV